MKKATTIVVCCALLAPLAFAQPESKGKTSTTEEITVTGAVIKMTSEEGSAANYQPIKTLVVLEDRSNTLFSDVSTYTALRENHCHKKFQASADSRSWHYRAQTGANRRCLSQID